MNIELTDHVTPQKCKYKSNQIHISHFTIVRNPYKVTQECISVCEASKNYMKTNQLVKKKLH